jgi:DNA ligase-1
VRRFAALYRRLDGITGNLARLAALRAYFETAPAEDAAWAVYFLAGGKPTQLVPTRVLYDAAHAATGLPEWLVDESYDAVGDLAETIALIVSDGETGEDIGLARWMQERLLPLRGRAPADQIARLRAMWQQMDFWERFTSLKLITGGLRAGVSRLLVTRALAAVADVDAKLVAQRLVGYTARATLPDAHAFRSLVAPAGSAAGADPGGQPYPFFLAHPLQADVAQLDDLLGPPDEWLIEWKWDGIRAQLVRRGGQTCSALRAAAAAHRPQGAEREAPRRSAGSAARLRRYRARRPRHPRHTARGTARAAGTVARTARERRAARVAAAT